MSNMSTAPTKVTSANRTSMSFRSRDAGSMSPRRCVRSDRSVGNKDGIGNNNNHHTATVCRRRQLDDPEYIGWRDESCRLLQRISPRRAASNRDGGAPTGDNRHGPTTNTYYQELIQQQLDRQRADREQQHMEILNYDRQSVFRCGSKGAPWRQLKLTTGAKGENIMFIDGDVKCKDMAKFYPHDSVEESGQRSFRGPPRPLPHFYVGTELSLDPNKTTCWLKERNDNNLKSPQGRTKKSDQVRGKGK